MFPQNGKSPAALMDPDPQARKTHRVANARKDQQWVQCSSSTKIIVVSQPCQPAPPVANAKNATKKQQSNVVDAKQSWVSAQTPTTTVVIDIVRLCRAIRANSPPPRRLRITRLLRTS